MDSFNFAIVVLIAFLLGIYAGTIIHEDLLIEETKQYNSIRMNGVYYYPEGGVINE